MILTVTLNPAVDVSYRIPDFQLDQVNRCQEIQKTAGGKGLNVTRVIHCVNGKALATGLLGGANGNLIRQQLDQSEITHDFVGIQGETRNCIAILHDDKQTEILESGPIITIDELETFLGKYEELLAQVEVVVASGSLPKGLPTDFYGQLIEMAHRYQKRFLLDTSGASFEFALATKPFLIKPNIDELSAWVGRMIRSEEEIIHALNQIASYDIPYIVVSLGKDGAIAMVEGDIYRVTVPSIETINPVGSGDSTMAGFAIALEKNLPPVEVLAYGSSLGTLNALELQTGYVQKEKVPEMLARVTVEKR
ncbi:1-phosphofructokinase family hexose kinase [Risungbinella massiliensis]|uniref:1-phosphofructokinase family hexose kinase n=1 Tax=Risungbinella massiliensis TaxID=1329796 RepID=UPI0005CC061F|nr:hexose kinase [Risungbinella massiliensis]